MKTIHKQELDLVGIQKIKVPKGSRLLSVATQRDGLCIWYCCDARSELEEIEIYIFGTGRQIPNDFDGSFIGTVLMANDNLVWHIFRKV